MPPVGVVSLVCCLHYGCQEDVYNGSQGGAQVMRQFNMVVPRVRCVWQNVCRRTLHSVDDQVHDESRTNDKVGIT